MFQHGTPHVSTILEWLRWLRCSEPVTETVFFGSVLSARQRRQTWQLGWHPRPQWQPWRQEPVAQPEPHWVPICNTWVGRTVQVARLHYKNSIFLRCMACMVNTCQYASVSLLVHVLQRQITVSKTTSTSSTARAWINKMVLVCCGFASCTLQFVKLCRVCLDHQPLFGTCGQVSLFIDALFTVFIIIVITTM